MKHIFKTIDLYGTNFQFNIFNKNKFKTMIGGFLTLICFILVILFSFFLGSDFFYKTNPKIITENIIPQESPKPLLLTPENLVIGWRFSDNNGASVDITNKIYPVITYYKLHFNSTTSEDIIEILQLTKCNSQNSKRPDFKFESFDLYCMDWTSLNYSLGGYWNEDFIDYFEMVMYYCPEGSKFSPEKNCTDLKVIKELVAEAEGGLYFDLFYPKFSFQPSEYSQPLQIEYLTHFFKVSLTINRVDRFYFENVELNDDQGWLMKNPQLSSILSFNRISSDFSYFDLNYYGKKGEPSDFYHLNLYSLKNKFSIKRSFMKIQDYAAVMGGFIKFISFISAIISNFFNYPIRNEAIFNHFFKYSKGDAEENRTKAKKYFNAKLYQEKIPESNKSMSINNLRNKSMNNLIDLSHQHNKEPLENNFIKSSPSSSIKIEMKNLVTFLDDKNFNKIPEILKRTNFVRIKSVNNTIKFGLCFKIKMYVCCKTYISDDLKKIYNSLKILIINRLDVLHYLKSLQILDRLRSTVFNYYQNLTFDYLRLQDLNNEKDMQHLGLDANSEEKFNQLIEYFRTRKISKNFNSTDQILYEMTEDQIKNKVEKNFDS
jgi:hypothetical protein